MNNLRHMFASQSLIEGCTPLEVSYLMGHSDPSVTLKVYSQWCDREKSQAATLLEQRFGKKGA